jgi:hypothetical protein
MKLSKQTSRMTSMIHTMVLLSFLAFSSPAKATNEANPPREPCQTNIPSPLTKPKNIVPLGCDRPFTIHGETYSADSPQAQDASTLRYFMKPVPEAESILAEYQENRKSSKASAYIGTLGIVMFVFSSTIAKQFDSQSQDSIRNTLRIGGLSLAGGGFFFTLTYLNDNEKLIPKSVDLYNKSKPNDPIELQFTTGWRF